MSPAWLWWLLPPLATLVARLATGPHAVDDAYITFRYARNLAEGHGLVYNPGEWVLGTTTPLWAGVLALAYRLGLTDLPAAALALSAAFDAASSVLLTRLTRRMGYPLAAAGLVGLAWAVSPMSVAYAAGGMETSLFVLAALGTLTLAASGRPALAGSLAGLASLVRPEAALLAAAVVAHAAWVRRRLPLAPIAAAALPALAWASLLLVRYGSPLPQSVLAKQAAYRVETPWINAFVLTLQAGLPGWSPFVAGALPPEAAYLLAAAGVATLVWLARRAVAGPSAPLPALDLRWLPFAAFGILYATFHALASFRGARLFPWYLVPLVPLYLLLAAAGLRAVAPRAPLLAAGLLVAWQLSAVDWRRPFLPAGFDLRREELYARVAADLARDLPADAVIAAPEIGVLGYRTDRRILDTVGLVSPIATRYYPLPAEQVEGDNAIPPRLIADLAPDAVVTLDQFARRSLLPDPEFQRRYRLEQSIAAPIWLSRNLLVFRRVDARNR